MKKPTTPACPSRRSFLAAVTAGTAAASMRSTRAAETKRLHVATNVYPWLTFYQRESRDFNATLDAGLAEVAAAGLDGFEPILNEPADVDRLAPLLAKHGLELRSFYVNTLLHDPKEAEKSIAHVVSVAERAKRAGARIVVTNPSPIRWGGPENKNDDELRCQAKALETLGARLRASGLTLAYHNHDIELRNAAREFHHMMVGTSSENVTLCLDAHWIYRGSGDSAVAVFDVLKLYGPRITELHLRQSANGIWTECLGEGDIDYPALARHVLSLGIRPHLVIEQAVEQGTPKTKNAEEAHRLSCAYARRTFAAFAG